MGEYFSASSVTNLGEFNLLVKPSAYDPLSSKWSKTEVESFLRTSEHPTAKKSLDPGSDRVKLLPSDDCRHVAVICESQWYEDLYILELPSLRTIASFEGTQLVDGSSEGFFLQDHFISLPTFSFEGGCGGLRKISLVDGSIEVLIPPDFFSDLRLWLHPANSKNKNIPGVQLGTPFGLLSYEYNHESGVLNLDYVAGQIKVCINNLIDFKNDLPFEFISRTGSEPF